MKAFLTLAFLIGAIGASGADESSEPGDQFVRAYMAFQRAEKFEQSHAEIQAIAAYNEAREILRDLQKRSPQWHVEILRYRKSRIETALNRLVPPGPDA